MLTLLWGPTVLAISRAANSIEFYSSSSSTYFSKSEFKFEFSNLIIYEFKFEFRQMNIQNRDNFFTAGAHEINKI